MWRRNTWENVKLILTTLCNNLTITVTTKVKQQFLFLCLVQIFRQFFQIQVFISILVPKLSSLLSATESLKYNLIIEKLSLQPALLTGRVTANWNSRKSLCRDAYTPVNQKVFANVATFALWDALHCGTLLPNAVRWVSIFKPQNWLHWGFK